MVKHKSPEMEDQTEVAREAMARRRKALWTLAQEIMGEDREILRELAKR
jgi:hypothetical protein